MEDEQIIVNIDHETSSSKLNIKDFKLYLMFTILLISLFSLAPCLLITFTVSNTQTFNNSWYYCLPLIAPLVACSFWVYFDSARFFDKEGYITYLVFTIFLSCIVLLSYVISLSVVEMVISMHVLNILGFTLLSLLEFLSDRIEHNWVKLSLLYITIIILMFLYLFTVNRYNIAAFIALLLSVAFQTYVESNGHYLGKLLVEKFGMSADYSFKDLLTVILMVGVDLIVCSFR